MSTRNHLKLPGTSALRVAGTLLFLFFFKLHFRLCRARAIHVFWCGPEPEYSCAARRFLLQVAV